MKLVHVYASFGVLLALGSLPLCHGDTGCSSPSTCEWIPACRARHGESLTSLLFPCTAKDKVCCPPIADPAKKLKARMSSMKLFDMEICGKETSDRIKNGYDAIVGQFPWMVLLGYSVKGAKGAKPPPYEFLCGGTLITKQFVLTAAHCLAASPKMLKVVRLGEVDIRTDPDCLFINSSGQGEGCAEKVVTRNVVKYIGHEMYNVRELKNDIALLKLDQPITINDWVRPICLPFNKTAIGADVKLRVSGWGKLDHNNAIGSKTLQWTYVNTTSNEDCNALIGPGNREITDKQICASGYNSEDACKGDSGGPLMFLDLEESAAFQVGIVSYGVRKCGAPNSPTVYTRVLEYIDWILETMHKM